jgi:hypothetical protein
MLDADLNLPDDTAIEMVRLLTIVRNALLLAGFRTIGEVRDTGDKDLRRIRRIGPGRLVYLRDTLGASKGSGK